MITYINDRTSLTIDANIYVLTDSRFRIKKWKGIVIPPFVFFVVTVLTSYTLAMISLLISCFISFFLFYQTDTILDFGNRKLSVRYRLGSMPVFKATPFYSFSEGLYLYIHTHVDTEYGNTYTLRTRLWNETFVLAQLDDYENGVYLFTLLQTAYPTVVFRAEDENS